jgi:hypothetical protein
MNNNEPKSKKTNTEEQKTESLGKSFEDLFKRVVKTQPRKKGDTKTNESKSDDK